MSLDNYIESAGNLQRIEDEIIQTKRNGENSTSEQMEELTQAMDETLSFIAEALNDGYSVLDLAKAAQQYIEVDAEETFGDDEYDDQEW